MDNQKGSGHENQPDRLNLIAAILNLITAALLIAERFVR
jgi:hypothetical protein